MNTVENHSVVDLFCGVGGLTHGFVREGFNVVAGIDNDASCRYAYEKNNAAKFICRDVRELSGHALCALYPTNTTRVLVGCAPCQPFSTYSNSNRNKDQKWELLRSFSRLVKEVEPEVVSMENVPQLADADKHSVFADFLKVLRQKKYHSYYQIAYCPDYGIPQVRQRLVLLASKFGRINLIPNTHSPDDYETVEKVISHLPPIKAGEQSSVDLLHKSRHLSELNVKRILMSKPGGTWRDWDDDLVAPCHRKISGKAYVSVYGRMEADKPAPTITTQFYAFGSGRFGHPTQHRALSLREGALLQTFPQSYDFIEPGVPLSVQTVGRHIGNAVPVRLGQVIAKSIKLHLRTYCNSR